MPKVSVIIPIYGVEKYIEKCSRSLFKQSLDDIEYIFIDDCTPDNSMRILGRVIDENLSCIAEKNWKVRTVKMPTNSGQAAVRRHGIQLATGEYVIHCDSDDWVDENIYGALYYKAIEDNADIVFCDYYQSYGDKCVVRKKDTSQKDNKMIIAKLLKGVGNFNPLWSAMVRKSVYEDNEIDFPIYNQTEDWALIIQLLWYSKIVSFVECPLYYYRNNDLSITHIMDRASIERRITQSIGNKNMVFNFMEAHGCTNLFKQEIVASKFLTRRIALPLRRFVDVKLKWMSIYPEVNTKDIYLNRYISLKNKLIHFVIKTNIYRYLRL